MGQGPGTKRINAQRKAQGRDNAEKWFRLRARAWTNAMISRKFGVTESAVSQAITKYLAERPIAGAEEVRNFEATKLDESERRLRKAVLDHLDHPDHLAKLEQSLSRVRERRAKLFGIDAPTRSIQTEEELEAAMTKLRDRLPPEVFEQVVSVLADVSVQHGEGPKDGADSAPVSGGDRGTEGGAEGA